MITVLIADNFIPERTYIVDLIFREFLGLDCRIRVTGGKQPYEIILENGNRLIIRDHFFSNFDDGQGYLDEESIPSTIVCSRNQFAPLPDIPVLFGSEELSVRSGVIICGIDVFASSFFMLTRWEEYANRTRDMHGRFPASAALAYKKGFLQRSVVNEYVEMLWNMLSHLRSGQQRKLRSFRTFTTHDVDAPFLHANKGIYSALKGLGGDLIRRKNPGFAFDNFNSWTRVACGREKDPFNTFDYIMDVSEKFGLTSSFLFMTDCSEPAHDNGYDLGHKLLRGLISNIHRRGHTIGLHSSYGSFNNPEQTKKEIEILKKVCAEEGIEQKRWTSRQHFLRWETPATFANLEMAHLDFDSTLSYADVAGFRCGVCYEYPVFDILKRRQLNLRERPLLVMECTVIDQRYMNLGTDDRAFSKIKSIKDTCRSFYGDFVSLWHNTRFIDLHERRLYNMMLEA